jgi:D-alanyl-D-alanine carboxypeptidase (penicillin-binding protein 5/6)
MKSKLMAGFATAALLFSTVCPQVFATNVQTASSGVEVSAKACLLMERETGTVLYAKSEHQQLEPASVTKVMTMLLVAEAVDSGAISLDDMVTTSEYAAGMGGSQVYLKEGEQMTVRDMLKSVAVASGNDAAVALAEHLAGSEGAFVEKMNQRAKELGMKDTHFCNCNGLPAEGHVTSAYDIALMSRELLSHDMIRDFVGIWMDTIRGGEFQLANTNKLIYYYAGATGLKTGSTDNAGYCISASAERDGMELIAVVLGSATSGERFASAKSLLNYGFGGYTLVDATPEGALPQVAVTLGTEEAVPTKLNGSCKLLVARDKAESVTTEFSAAEAVEAPVQAGDKLGTLSICVDGKEAQQVDLIAGADVERLNFMGIFHRLWERMAMQSSNS